MRIAPHQPADEASATVQDELSPAEIASEQILGERDAEGWVPEADVAVRDVGRGGTAVLRVVDGISRWIDHTCEVVVAITVVVNIAIIFASVVHRAITGSPILWADSSTEVLLAGIAFFGGVTALFGDEHVKMRVLSNRLSPRWRAEADGLIAAMVCVFSLLLAWQGATLATAPELGVFPQTGWSTNIVYIPLAVGAALLFVVALIKLVRQSILVRVPWAALGLLVVVAAALWYFQPWIQAFYPGGSLIAAAGVLALGVAIGIPIAMTMGMAASLGIWLSNGLTFQQVPLAMSDEVINLSILALPFFVVVGIVFGVAGVGQKLTILFQRMTRGLPGGDLVSAVVSMFAFSGLSGSKIADVAAVAPAFTEPLDDDAGAEAHRVHDARLAETTGVLAAAAVMGEAIPPSNVMLVLGSITTVSTGALFLAGIIPAILAGICICCLAVFLARRQHRVYTPTGTSLPRTILQAIPAVVGILVVVVGITSGIATPAESSAVAAVYAFFVALVVYRIGFKALWKAIARASRLAGMLLFLVAAGGVLSSFLTSSGLADYVNSMVRAMHGHALLFMAASVVLLIVMGSIFEGLPAIVVFAPLLVPAAAQFNIDPVQYSIVLLLAMGVGSFLPPFGVGFYSTAAIMQVPPERAVIPTLRYKTTSIIAICLIAAIPPISLWLPHLAGL